MGSDWHQGGKEETVGEEGEGQKTMIS